MFFTRLPDKKNVPVGISFKDISIAHVRISKDTGHFAAGLSMSTCTLILIISFELMQVWV